MYETVTTVSSNSANTTHSQRLIDELLLNKGYSYRMIERIQSNTRKWRRNRVRILSPTIRFWNYHSYHWQVHSADQARSKPPKNLSLSGHHTWPETKSSSQLLTSSRSPTLSQKLLLDMWGTRRQQNMHRNERSVQYFVQQGGVQTSQHWPLQWGNIPATW